MLRYPQERYQDYQNCLYSCMCWYRNNTCTNTDSTGSLDTALVDMLASLSVNFESKCWRRRKYPKHSSKDTMYIICVFNNFIEFVNRYVLLTGSWQTLMGGSNCIPLYRILQREHKKMGCRNNTCTNTDSSGSLDTALVDILVSLSGSFESKCWRRRKSPKHSSSKTQWFSSMYTYSYI